MTLLHTSTRSQLNPIGGAGTHFRKQLPTSLDQFSIPVGCLNFGIQFTMCFG